MIQKLSHATIYVLDQDAARDFYVNKLDSRSAWTKAWKTDFGG
jgi:catechol 2,3-dioxygenase-like lactoylglutathione lyase family enzyme